MLKQTHEIAFSREGSANATELAKISTAIQPKMQKSYQIINKQVSNTRIYKEQTELTKVLALLCVFCKPSSVHRGGA
jgi:hypothetical protein